MKILHTADWHLGKRLEHISRLDEQREVLEEICQIAENQAVDVVLVAGDLFDNFSPSAEATELLYSTLVRLSAGGKRAVIAIAGNHDSPERIEVPDAMARACGVIFAGFPDSHIRPFRTQGGIEVLRSEAGFIELKTPHHNTPLRILLTPYANELRLRTFLGVENTDQNLRQVLATHWQTLANKYCDSEGVNLLLTHLYFMKNGDTNPPEEPDDERSVLHVGGAAAIFSENVPAQIQYVALGHLHRFQTIDTQPCPMVYSSSPLAYSFAESNQTKYVVIIDIQANKAAEYEAIALEKPKKLLREKFDNIDNAVAWLEANSKEIVQLTIVTDNYLEPADKKRLIEAHPNLLPIIPEIRKDQDDTSNTAQAVANLQEKSMEELFKEYFKSKKKGQNPNESLVEIFREILAEE
jgi:DNA repair protein SbcD/Mre11